MGRKPRQEPLKEYLENPRTTWLFSSPSDYAEVFPQGDKATSELYLKPAVKGTRLGKGTYRLVLHLPNKHHNDREAYMKTLEGGSLARYLEGGPLQASRIRFDSGSYPSVELILHTQKGKRVNFYLTPANHAKGGVVYAQTTFPSPVSRKLVTCPVQVGYFGVSASRPGEFKLTLQKPRTECAKGLVAAGHAPSEFLKPEKKKKKTTAKVAQAETEEFWMTEEDHKCFYEAQGIDMNKLLEIQDVEIMDSETETQAHERQYYNLSDAMVGDETLEGFTPTDSTTVDLTSNQPTANFGAEHGKKMMCADCGSKKVMYAEGETATYAPSNEPDMVSSSDFDTPTNENFSAEGEAVEESVEPASEPVAVAEGTSLDGYAPIDSLEEGAPIGHGVNQYFGSAEGTEEALMDESTTNITVEEGVSLEGFSGVDSVVVEAPLGHGVTQWYAESDSPEPQFDDGITGQDGPSADPTNANFSAQGYNDRDDESIGMRHRGMHEQSLKDRRDESKGMTGSLNPHHPYSDVSTMSAESKVKFSKDKKGRMYARNRKTGEIITHNADTAGYLQDGSLSMDGYTPLESVEVDRSSYQPTQNYGAEFEGEFVDDFKKGAGLGSGFSVGFALPGIVVGLVGLAAMTLIGKSESE